jgi:hypothetical protein
VSESVIATNSKTPVLKSEQFLSGALKQELKKIRIRNKDKSDFKSTVFDSNTNILLPCMQMFKERYFPSRRLKDWLTAHAIETEIIGSSELGKSYSCDTYRRRSC